MKPMVIFGNRQMAEIVNFYFQNDTDRDVVAFTVEQEYIDSDRFQGLPVVAFESIASTYPPEDFDLFIAIGYKHLNLLRRDKFVAAKKLGYSMPSYISSKATVWCPLSSIGENCFILEDNTIQPFTQIGDNVVMWSGNHLGHHSTIGDHCFVTSHVVISGNVEIKERCFFGVNATIRDGIKIGAECIIGAGSWINKTTPNGAVLTTPAAKIRNEVSDGVKI